MVEALKPESLCRRFAPESLPFDTTERLPATDGIVGQPRAVEALALGLEIEDPTFHVFVSGRPGSGRTSAVKTFLEALAQKRSTPSDWVYVNDFDTPERPRAIALPSGRGREFASDMQTLLTRVRDELPRAFDSDDYGARREEIQKDIGQRRDSVFARLNEKASEHRFFIKAGPLGVLLIPLKEDGEPMSEEEAKALSDEDKEALESRHLAIEEMLKRTLKEVRELEHEAHERLTALDRDVALFVVGGLVDDVAEKYKGHREIADYLDRVKRELSEKHAIFREPEKKPGLFAREQPVSRDFEVNLIVDRTDEDGAPVVIEQNPTYANLFGRIEKESHLGAIHTDFTLIKAGALHRANGGYLVIPARELLTNFMSYESLKRALTNRTIDIEEPAERLGLSQSRVLRPEPLPLDVKVVLIGTARMFRLLYRLDEDFNELFKIRADFDDRMVRDDEDIGGYLSFIRTLCERECLPHMDREAVSLIVEHGSRLAEDQGRLSTHFARLADVIREASHYAKKDSSRLVRGGHVQIALDAQVRRASLIEDRVQEAIERELIHIATDGKVAGEINALSVIDLGDHRFGRPSRISATVSMGKASILDIEREAKLGGPIHSKGVMILSGLLLERFAQDFPLTLAARLVFEQSYGGVEGDSASCAEYLALVSALADAPLHQGIAITGSIDQKGRAQVIGGVNEKVEGFFDVCESRGLTGRQGVLIPAANRSHLMLRERVVRAVERGEFHVYTYATAEDALALLSDETVGERGPDGQYPEGSLYRRISDRLHAMSLKAVRFSRLAKGGPDNGSVGSAGLDEVTAEGKSRSS